MKIHLITPNDSYSGHRPAVSFSSQIILADEPTGNLDSVTSDKIYDLFRELSKRNIAIIIVTHNAELAQRADRMITIRDGLLHDSYPAVCCPGST